MYLSQLPADILNIIWTQAPFVPLVDRTMLATISLLENYKKIVTLPPIIWEYAKLAFVPWDQQNGISINIFTTDILPYLDDTGAAWVYKNVKFIYNKRNEYTIFNDPNKPIWSYAYHSWLPIALKKDNLPLVQYIYSLYIKGFNAGSRRPSHIYPIQCLYVNYSDKIYSNIECFKWLCARPEYQTYDNFYINWILYDIICKKDLIMFDAIHMELLNVRLNLKVVSHIYDFNKHLPIGHMIDLMCYSNKLYLIEPYINIVSNELRYSFGTFIIICTTAPLEIMHLYWETAYSNTYDYLKQNIDTILKIPLDEKKQVWLRKKQLSCCDQ